MLFSYSLLSRLVDLSSFKLQEVIDRLTFSGFEVEDHHPLASASKLVIGQILSCEPVEGSDHLHALKVDCGNEGVLDIVCGAKNARTGLKVIVALPGCVLNSLGITIKKGHICGKESNGMCCSLVELGLDKSLLSEKEVSGIHELDADAPVGCTEVLDYLHLNDEVLDVNVLPNRPDCLSYIGLARELSALLGAHFNEYSRVDLQQFPSKFILKSHTDKCPRLDFLGIEKIKTKAETPSVIKAYLIASGIRSVSPIVDLGNFSMLLTGQPLNMYDAKRNPSLTYQVYDDYEGPFTFFDGKAVQLQAKDLVVFDDKKAICLAGIMAGQNESISDDTVSIAIEAASFYHANIRHTAIRLGVSSFSQQLFGKSRNPYMIDEAIQITIALLPVFFDEYKIFSYTSLNTLAHTEKAIEFSLDKMNHRLGSSYTTKQVDEVLKRYRIKKEGSLLYPPIDRVDLKEQCDIEEEVFRFYDAEMIKPSLEHSPITHGKLSDEQKYKRRIREFLVSEGYDEILSFTLIDEKMDRDIRIFSHAPSYRIINPMTRDHEYVRSDLVSSMKSTLEYNIVHKQTDLKLFEISHVDLTSGHELYLSLGLSGNCYSTDLLNPRPYNFFDLKGIITDLLSMLGINESRYQIAYSKNPAFHPLNSADIYIGKTLVGTFGRLHPTISKTPLFVGELNLGYLLSLKGSKTKFISYSQYPTVRRDLSFALSSTVTYQDILNVIRKSGVANLQDVKLFDLFKDKDNDITYIGISIFLGKNGTLKEEEINVDINKIIDTLKDKLGLKLRGEE